MSPTLSPVTVAPTADGCLIRVDGRGTVRESKVIRDIARRMLTDVPESTVTLDLSACPYVDSTFLGCLLQVRKAGEKRFVIAAPPEHRKKLLGLARLDLVLVGVDAAPETTGPAVPIATSGGEDREILRHVMECHRQLAEIEGPMRVSFEKIATRMQRELESSA